MKGAFLSKGASGDGDMFSADTDLENNSLLIQLKRFLLEENQSKLTLTGK